jgi:hypothetical protein
MEPEPQGPGVPQAAPRNFRVFEGCTSALQGRRRQAPQDRRRLGLTFGGGGAEIRRRASRLWSLKLVLDALRCMQPSTQYKTRPSQQAEHVAERAGPAEARGEGRRQPAPGELQGHRGWNCRAHSGTSGELQEAGGGRNVLTAVLSWLAIWNSRV